MSDSTPLKPSAGAASAFAAGAGVRVLFIAVICLSAFLLFLVQPMFAKMALPLLGGAPAVWTTAMLFFQAILLAGYAYAHWITSRLQLKWQLQVHLAITAVAALALPIAIPAGWTPPADDSSASLWLLALFTASLGAPFFALSANAPLLQKWYAATGGRDADDPYFLYAASNIGSFGALLAFPFLLEPLIGVREQSAVWTLGFCLLMAGLAVAGLTARRAMPAEAMARASATPTATDRPDWRRVLLWIGLAFVPSSMMLSVTAKIATDLGSFPLIWVTTLALYLLTYVFAFSNSFRAKARALPMVHMVLVLVAIFVALLNPGGALSHGKIGLYMVLLFVTALAFHSKLADARPSERHLTAFYLAMSAGGALGGLFNSVLGPMVFNDIYEFPVVLALAFFAGPAGLIAWRRDLPMAAGLGAAVLAAAWFGAANSETDPKLASTVFLVGIVASLAVLYLWRGHPLRQMMGAAVVIGGFSTVLSAGNVIYQERSFFGVYRVVDLPEDNLRLIYHDTTIHGMLKKTDGRPIPAGYYDPVGPFGQYFRMLEDDSDVGIVGLGAGGLACYRPDPMSMTFYEIDPTVDRIARNTALFPMLDRCAPETATVIGDARIRIADAGERIHDHLLLDAFSSDAVPVHLLTKEAFDLYDRAITPGGTIFVHISNRYFMLDGPVARVAQAAGFATFTQHFSPTEKQREEDLVAPSIALIATKNPDRIAALEADPQWQRAPGWDGPVWTDDYANTLSALR